VNQAPSSADRSWQARVAALAGQVDHGAGPDASVQVVVQQHLGARRTVSSSRTDRWVYRASWRPPRGGPRRVAGAPLASLPRLRECCQRADNGDDQLPFGRGMSAEGAPACDAHRHGIVSTPTARGRRTSWWRASGSRRGARAGESSGAVDRVIDAAGRLVIPARSTRTAHGAAGRVVTSKDTSRPALGPRLSGTTTSSTSPPSRGGSLGRARRVDTKADGTRHRLRFHMRCRRERRHARRDGRDGGRGCRPSSSSRPTPVGCTATTRDPAGDAPDRGQRRARADARGERDRRGCPRRPVRGRGKVDPWYHGLAHAASLEGRRRTA